MLYVKFISCTKGRIALSKYHTCSIEGFFNFKFIFVLTGIYKMRSFILVMVGVSLGYASNLDPSIEGSIESGAMNSMRRNPKLFWGVSKHHRY